MTLQSRFDAKFQIVEPGGCWIWTAALDDDGYGRIGAGSGAHLAHRISWSLHNGPIPDGLCVLHRCDVRCCVRPDHLWIGTRGENNLDMAEKGRSASGETNGQAKLTNQQVVDIRALGNTTSYKEIGYQFSVTRQHVGDIINGKYRREA